MLRQIKWILMAVAVIAVALAAVYFSLSAPKKTIDVGRGRVADVRTMARLCSVDFYNEVPVLDTLHGKMMVAIQKQRGSISFDLEKISADTTGDTVKVTLPPAVVEIYEATDPNSWQVVDTKAVGRWAFFRSDKFTAEEENELKRNMKAKAEKRLYADGTVARARAEASGNLKTLLERVYRKPVIVN